MDDPKIPTTLTEGVAELYDALASRCTDLQGDYHIDMNRCADKENALKATLHPAMWAAVHEALEQRDVMAQAFTDLLVAELGRHLPGLAPALMLVWDHVKEITPKNVGFCCIGNGSFEPGHEPEDDDAE